MGICGKANDGNGQYREPKSISLDLFTYHFGPTALFRSSVRSSARRSERGGRGHSGRLDLAGKLAIRTPSVEENLLFIASLTIGRRPGGCGRTPIGR